ncbi:MAG: Gfo/Idh/MocA family oxidoreductase [Armatimonadota bacterium]|nr:Gfo/Idh/MocA family oxidoreductase [bacterium]
MKAIRIGVFGAGRGSAFAENAQAAGMELVAVCDCNEDRLRHLGEHYGIATYADFDRFLEHDMDAIVLANFFHQHAPFAVKALDAGFHVMSECAACHTLGEAAALARAVERNNKIYMLAENYPYMRFNQEMRRLYQEGTIGKFLYGEGEYVHPGSARMWLSISVGKDHWRNWIPATYYCTHSIAPVMYITDTRPVTVNGFIVPRDLSDDSYAYHVSRNDTAAMIVLRMDNGAVVKSLHGSLRGHGNYVRIHGNKGQMENCRIVDGDQIRLRIEPFGKDCEKTEEKVYLPDWPGHAAAVEAAGHGGGDFWTNYHFANAIRTGEQPYLNVYRAIDMSICGILAYKSSLQQGAPIDIPDFRDEAVRVKYENDNWSPDPERRGPGQPYPSVLGDLTPTPEAVDYAHEVWAEQGYTGE